MNPNTLTNEDYFNLIDLLHGRNLHIEEELADALQHSNYEGLIYMAEEALKWKNIRLKLEQIVKPPPTKEELKKAKELEEAFQKFFADPTETKNKQLIPNEELLCRNS